jgi:hypothetical protein
VSNGPQERLGEAGLLRVKDTVYGPGDSVRVA